MGFKAEDKNAEMSYTERNRYREGEVVRVSQSAYRHAFGQLSGWPAAMFGLY
jgi:hypothetical protein